jgi:pSer/pThr/pTyr-binding forkhead associated (FHA) protein
MVTKLVVASGKSAGRAIAVKRNRLLIGRAEECDIRPLSEDVSRRHCAVIVGPAAVWVEDLGSRNGTFVDGSRITGKVQVADGAMIRVGSLELKVSCSDPAAKGGSEEDVSRWLMADDQPAGMFDTTHTMPVPQESTGTTLVAGAAPPASVEAATGTTPVPVDAGAAATPSSAAIAIEALKAGKGSKPSGLPSQARKGADSSRDAAAEALKRFFDNR